jgi:hypothetical protein
MHDILPIAHLEAVAATRRGLHGARIDDPRARPARKLFVRTTRPGGRS